MNAALQAVQPSTPTIESIVADACRIVAPNWPLDRQIAVNPYWGLIDRPFEQAAAEIQRVTGGRFALRSSQYRQAWQDGEITAQALTKAVAEFGLRATNDAALAALREDRPDRRGRALPSDVIDHRGTPGAAPAWRDTITQQVSQYCASYFDAHQADWHRPKSLGLFDGWRHGLQFDHALEPLMHAPEIRARAHLLPSGAIDTIEWSLDRLGVPAEDAVEFLRTCLMRINGWAAWCAYLRWEAGLAGQTDMHLVDLLAIRVGWEALLCGGPNGSDPSLARWHALWVESRHADGAAVDWDRVWQRAHEISYQDRLIAQLATARAPRPEVLAADRRSAQLVFCIDVRSERFRRALESVDPTVQTIGFAGFFGLPIQYSPLGIAAPRPQLPGLLAPTLGVTETTGDRGTDETIAARRADRLTARTSLRHFLRLPSGNFSLVETLGLGYAGTILRRHFGHEPRPVEALGLSAGEQRALRPHLELTGDDPVGRRAELAASTLRAMGLTRDFARLLVLVGHGSQSANNPQAAALDCGACGGQTGEINARTLAGLLNDAAVRNALRDRGINLPEDTLAMGALHNTTTDEVEWFDTERLPDSHAADLDRLRRNLQQAGHGTRAERAPSLGLERFAQRPDALLKQVRRRARDWAETRPEWGLAGNAAFVIAPRARTADVDLAGRSFLHDYDWRADHDGQVLELLLTAPMVVTHWINLQYFASTVDPERFGSGNKVLHNVACGRIGVFEGNTGDLRIGLSRQSLHDGRRWMHAPLRLSVFVDAPRERIEAILQRHTTVRQLVEHQWLHLFRFVETEIEWRCGPRWQAWRDAESAS